MSSALRHCNGSIKRVITSKRSKTATCTRHISSKPTILASLSTKEKQSDKHINPLFHQDVNYNNHSTINTFWGHIPQAPPDPILGITEVFNKDNNPKKVNLSVGAYRDDRGKPFVLPSIKMASEILYHQEENKEYTGITGSSRYNALVQKFLFSNHKYGGLLYNDGRIVTSQSISGTGALKIAGEFLKIWSPYPDAKSIYIPNPTWANHVSIFTNSGLTPKYYTYLDSKTRSINMDSLIKDLSNAEMGSSVLLHACCHNPTGLDPTKEDWSKIITVIKERSLIPIIDIAYQGFQSSDLQKDLFLLELFNKEIYEGNLPTAIICQSFAKNMGLYGERIGSLSIITSSESISKKIDSQIKKIIRSIYSSPSIHGSKLVEIVLSNPKIYSQWEKDILTMSNRIKDMRYKLHSLLLSKNSNMNWDHLIRQNGMFCYTGLNEGHIQKLASKFSIYATMDGRFSISGINNGNIEYLANAIDEVTKE